MNSNKPLFVQRDLYFSFEEPLTGNILYVNKSKDKFLILPNFEIDRFQIALREVEAQSLISPSATPELRSLIDAFWLVRTEADFEVALDRLIGGRSIPGNQNVGRIADCLFAFWWGNLIALPRITATDYLGRLTESRVFYGSTEDMSVKTLLDEIRDAGNSADATTLQHIRLIVTLLTSIGGAKGVGDLGPRAIDGRLLTVKLGKSMARVLSRIMQRHYPSSNAAFGDYGTFGKKSTKHDKSFAWVAKERSDLDEWRLIAEAWMTHLRRDHASSLSSMIAMFKALIGHAPEMLSVKAVLLDAKKFPKTHIKDRYHNPLHTFFDWVIATHFTVDDGTGRPEVLRGVENPFYENKNTPAHFETVYDVMPTRFVRRIREIIEDNDFAFPKQALGRKTDYIRFFDKQSKEWTDVWCPIRALVILIKLDLPERTFQVRMCNSGEADPERYDPITEAWITNDHPLAGQLPHGKPMGLAVKIKDTVQNKITAGMYFNTNKSGDTKKDASQRGHIIPWKNDRVFHIAEMARKFQEQYNPITQPTKWSDLKEKAIQIRYSQAALEERGAETFLFRDACGPNPDQPIDHHRMVVMWNTICEELERRLKEEGQLGPDGLPFTLVTRDQNGRVSGAIFPLHSLRPTVITAFAEAGVPFDILMKVTGHATAAMVAYYGKQSAGHVTKILNEASFQVMQAEQVNWEQFLRDLSADQLTVYIAFNDTVGLNAFANAHPSSRVRLGFGICPVGCKRCHEGGPPIKEGAKQHGPVPGPAQNCILCRFFITGVPFVMALAAHFEYVQFQYKHASKLYTDAERDFETADYQRRKSLSEGQPYQNGHKLDVLSANLDQRTKEVDDWALTWHAVFNRLEDCRQLRPAYRDHNKFGLIVADSFSNLDFVLEVDDTNESEIEWLDKICQQSTFFKATDPTLPNLRRMRRFDAFIKRQGYSPVFVDFTEEECLQYGNEFGKFMYTTLGTKNANDLLNGKVLLESLGVVEKARVLRKLDEMTSILPELNGQGAIDRSSSHLTEPRFPSNG